MARQISGKFPLIIGGQFTPHIASTIFNLLDKQELTKSRSVSSTWKDVVDSRTTLWNDPELYREAAIEGNLEMCKMIIEKADNKNPTLKYGGLTPLHIAPGSGYTDIFRLIFENVQDKNPPDSYGDTPLHLAARRYKVEICRLILAHVHDKQPLNNQGKTPLDKAREELRTDEELQVLEQLWLED